MNWRWFILVVVAYCVGGGHLTAFAEKKADIPIFQVQGQFKDQNGMSFKTESLRGKHVIASVAYTTCPSICLFTVESLKKIEKGLEEKDKHHFLLISADPLSDKPEDMKSFLKKHGVKSKRWTFVTGNVDDQRRLAGSVGMGFSAKTGSNHIMHSIEISLINKNGFIQKKIKGLKPPIGELISAANNP
jgi:protein SCO1/2